MKTTTKSFSLFRRIVLFLISPVVMFLSYVENQLTWKHLSQVLMANAVLTLHTFSTLKEFDEMLLRYITTFCDIMRNKPSRYKALLRLANSDSELMVLTRFNQILRDYVSLKRRIHTSKLPETGSASYKVHLTAGYFDSFVFNFKDQSTLASFNSYNAKTELLFSELHFPFGSDQTVSQLRRVMKTFRPHIFSEYARREVWTRKSLIDLILSYEAYFLTFKVNGKGSTDETC